MKDIQFSRRKPALAVEQDECHILIQTLEGVGEVNVNQCVTPVQAGMAAQ